jgi:hypothetical protein
MNKKLEMRLREIERRKSYGDWWVDHPCIEALLTEYQAWKKKKRSKAARAALLRRDKKRR